MAEPTYLITNETENELGDRVVLYYYVIESKPKQNEFNSKTYGIGIDMYTQLPGQRTLKEKKYIEDVFTNEKDAKKMTDILCRGCVTPVTLKDVLYDRLSQAAI